LFTRSLVATAVAAVTMVATPAIAEETDAKYEVYGVIAVQAHYRNYETENSNLTGLQTNNESRIGFRGSKQFANFGPKFIWQVESGYVDPSYSDHEAKGGLGERDTFVGFEDFDSFGQVRIGRVLTPLYEVVDWPGANPGLGDVYDWGGLIGGAKFQDRSSNSVRWDSPAWGNLSLDVAAGRTKAAATGSDQGYWQGAAAHYKVGVLQFDAAYEINRDTAESFQDGKTTEIDKGDPNGGLKYTDFNRIWDNNTYLVGVQGWFENGVSFFAQYRMQDAKVTEGTDVGREEKQNAMTSGLMYTVNDWQFKVGYTKN
ncbi:MAG: porin, partial [Alteromonas sp.]|nr:porin [Alteromonas sp.]